MVGIEDWLDRNERGEQQEDHGHPVAVEEEGDPRQPPAGDQEEQQDVAERRHQGAVRPQEEVPEPVQEEQHPERRGRQDVPAAQLPPGIDIAMAAAAPARHPRKRLQHQGDRPPHLAVDVGREQQDRRRQHHPYRRHPEPSPQRRPRLRDGGGDQRQGEQGEERYAVVDQPVRQHQARHPEPRGRVGDDELQRDQHHPGGQGGEERDRGGSLPGSGGRGWRAATARPTARSPAAPPAAARTTAGSGKK